MDKKVDALIEQQRQKFGLCNKSGRTKQFLNFYDR